eukprot:m.180078 g.180078  ORF g.180078 m.180078 type:complete len:357 (-) comp14926_c0_seq1:252-1322(-)
MSMFGSLFGEEANKNGDEGTDEGSGGEGVDMGAEVSNLFGSFLTLAQGVGAAVKENAERVVKTGEIPLIGEFQREQSKFISEKKGGQGGGLPPWEGYEEEDKLREQILALSTDRRNFLRDPPAGQTAFKFDYARESPTALVMLQEDPNLSKMRFELVPKEMSEDRFWRNYFYRVYLMKQTCEVSSLASDERAAAARASVPAPAPSVTTNAGTPDGLNDAPGLDDDADAFETSTLAASDNGVNLADLGGDLDDDDEVTFARQTPSDAATPLAGDATRDGAGTKEQSPSKPPSSTPSSNGEGGGVSSDNSWDKGEIETETDMSEFELLKDDGPDVELEEGWEDEVNAMLEDEEDEDDS